MAEIDDGTSVPEETQLERESEREAEHVAQKSAERRANRPLRILQRNIQPQEMFALVGGFGFLALLLASMVTSFINPVFPLGALIFFLYPFRKLVVPRRTMQLGILSFLVWLTLNLSGVLFPFIVAFIVAYLFSPLIVMLQKRSVPRWVSALMIALGILGVYAAIGIFLIPTVVEQFQTLSNSMQSLVKDAGSLLDRAKLVQWLTSYGVPQKQAQDLVDQNIVPQVTQFAQWLFAQIGEVIKNVSTILEGVVNLALIPILSFYLLLDFERIRIFIRSTLLQDNPRYVYYVKKVDVILSSYLRGILLTSSLVGGMAIAFLSIANVPYAVVLGILTGIFNLIPTVGIFMNLGVAMIIFLFAPDSFWYNILMTSIMVFGLHALNGYLIEPRVIGDRVGLHPVLLIASLFVFSHFLGFVGLLVAVPASAVIIMFLKEWYRSTVEARRPVTVTSHPSSS